MQDITVARYPDLTWGGYIEPKDQSWIIFLDSDGTPVVYFAEREADGAVVESSKVDL